MRRPLIVLLLMLTWPVLGHDFGNLQKSIRRFEDPARAQWQKPDLVVARLAVKLGQSVADIGAGTGYFARRLARAVGPRGRVFALDIEPALVRYMEERAAQEGQWNIVPRVIPTDDPQLPAASMDLVLIVNTLHHIENRAPYYAHILRSLRPHGRLAVVDFYDRATGGVGPPLSMRLSAAQVESEVLSAGFTRVEVSNILPYQYILVAR